MKSSAGDPGAVHADVVASCKPNHSPPLGVMLGNANSSFEPRIVASAIAVRWDIDQNAFVSWQHAASCYIAAPNPP